jgi:hypothetical protein
MSMRHSKYSVSKNSFAETEYLFCFSSIPVTYRKYPNILALHHWLRSHVKKPNLAFPYGDCLPTATKKTEYFKNLLCTFHYSQSLNPKQLELQLRIWMDMLKELCEQRKSKKVYPSLLIPCPNMGPTSFTWFHGFHKSMDNFLIKEDLTLWTFNPAATKSRNYKKLKSQTIFPPVPFLHLRKLVKDDINYFKEQTGISIHFHQHLELHSRG